MNDLNGTGNSEIIVLDHDSKLNLFELGMMEFLGRLGLPNTSILNPVNERVRLFKNLDETVKMLDSSRIKQSYYLSKFVAAVASGLFDAALNYLWDETIIELRKRVANFDLSYFFDNAGLSEKDRPNFKSEEDLEKLLDNQLIIGAKNIELISSVGFHGLEHIRFMRNHASAAHPNQNELTALNLLNYLESCIKHVICLPIPGNVIEIKKLLSNVKSTAFSPSDAQKITTFFDVLTSEQSKRLVRGLFGIYIDPNSQEYSRTNINMLAQPLWVKVDEDTKKSIGVKYGSLVANSIDPQNRNARSFLENVGGLSYIPKQLKIYEIRDACESLLQAHRGINNFYSEPIFAENLRNLSQNFSSDLDSVDEIFITTVIEAFLSNGNGVAWNADPIYIAMISNFNQKQAFGALISFQRDEIRTKLSKTLPQKKFSELLQYLRPKFTTKAVDQLIDHLVSHENSLDKQAQDHKAVQLIENIKKSIQQ